MVPQGIRPVVQLTAVEVLFIFKLTENKCSNLIFQLARLFICFEEKKNSETQLGLLVSIFGFIFSLIIQITLMFCQSCCRFFFFFFPTEKTLFLLSFFLSIMLSILILYLSLSLASVGFYFTDSGLGVAEHEKLPTGTCYITESHSGMWGWNGGICGDQKPQKNAKFSIFCSLHESCTLLKTIYYISYQ